MLSHSLFLDWKIMAPGGGSRRQSDDEQDGNGEQRPSYQRANSVDEVSGQAPAIVTTFLGECFRADGLPVPQELSENQKRVNKEVAHVIRDIGDRLANDTTLNNLISQVVVSKDTAFDTFLQVGAQIFNDGRVNWGRIVTLFYFGYVALQVINQIPIIILVGCVNLSRTAWPSGFLNKEDGRVLFCFWFFLIQYECLPYEKCLYGFHSAFTSFVRLLTSRESL